MKLTELHSSFQNPSREYRMTPLLRINDEISEEHLRYQLQSLKTQGFGGVFLCCEYFQEGAPEKFCTDWWWKVVDMTARLCAEYGLAFWAYDEEDWPSGSIGGQLVERYPDYSWKYLHCAESAHAGGSHVSLEAGEGGFVAASAFQLEDNQLIEDTLTDLTPLVNEGRLEWDAPAGNWTVALYTARKGLGLLIDVYGDLMSREAMGEFVSWVYGGHEERVKAIPGASITGFFTDEPAFSLSMIEWERFPWYPSMPFTPELEKTFEARHSMPWRRNLPLLYHPAGPERLRFQCRYWETCCYLYSENYFGQIYRFCEERGMLSSGHLVIEEEFYNHLAQQGGNLPTHFRYMHVPGMDWIHPFEETFHDLPATTPKYPTSMAHLMGRHQSWAETFAASGWGITPRDMRRIVNWEHVNGISMQVPICYKYSLRGINRTTFYPPGLSYQQPYWDHIRPFADYEARVCSLTAGSGHRAQVALAYPEVDIWTHAWDHDTLRERSKSFNALGDAIRFAGYDFDILDDRAFLEQSCCAAGQIVTATERFDVVVAPPVDGVRVSLLTRWEAFVASGGTLLFVGSLPKHSYEQGTDDPAVASSLVHLLGTARPSERPFWHAHPSGGRAGFAPTVADVPALLGEACEPELQWEGPGRFVAFHRILDDGDVFLVFNYTDAPCETCIRLKAEGAVELWDAETGACTPMAPEHAGQGYTWLRLAFAPYAMQVLAFHRDGAVKPIESPCAAQAIEISGPFTFSAEETFRRPEIAWNFAEDAEGYAPSHTTPLAIPAQLNAGDWSEQGLAHFSGIGCYAFEAVLPEEAATGRVLLDLGEVHNTVEVIVNGQPAGIKFFEPYELDITGKVRPGVNQFEVRVANTLSNYMAQFPYFNDKPLNGGGDFPERRRSGLFGPVRIQVR